jgi:tetratricopeptide (TPR) repeat protein
MEARSNLAVTLRRQGELAAAADVLRQIIESQSDYGPAHFNLAELLRQMWAGAAEQQKAEIGREALEHYRQALLDGYEPARTVQRRAEFALQLDDLDAAEEDLLEITRDPDLDPDIVYLLARVKKEQGDFRVAGQLLEMAFAAGLDTGEAHSDAGEIHLRAGRIDEAIESFEKAIERRPELIITRVNLSIALAMRGDLPGADAALREAEARDPRHAAVRAQRAALLKAGGGQP